MLSKYAICNVVADREFKFLNEEWPAMLMRIHQLGLDIDALLKSEPVLEGNPDE